MCSLVSTLTYGRRVPQKQLSGIDTNEMILTVNLNGTDKSSGQQGSVGREFGTRRRIT